MDLTASKHEWNMSGTNKTARKPVHHIWWSQSLLLYIKGHEMSQKDEGPPRLSLPVDTEVCSGLQSLDSKSLLYMFAKSRFSTWQKLRAVCKRFELGVIRLLDLELKRIQQHNK